MAEFWLISVPLDKASSQCLEKLKRATVKAGLGSYFRFHIPELKVGTLDMLLSVSDDLSRLDSYTEGVIRQTAQCMAALMEQSGEKFMEPVLSNGEKKPHRKSPQSPLKMYFQALRVDLTTYMTKFQWDRAKYPTALGLKPLSDLIFKQVAQVETELKSRNAAYSDVNLRLRSLEGKKEGSLHSRSLAGIVKKEDLVLSSEYLTTLLVVVPRVSMKQWENTYETLSRFVVPRSSRKLLEEEEAGIFTVTLFKNSVDDFKAKAKKQKFAVRDFSFEEAEKQQLETNRLNMDKREQFGMFVRWLKVNLNEVFVAWIHIKALRVFVESVLRYGLPVSFQTLLLQPQKKQVNRLREELDSVFTHLTPTTVTGKQELGLDTAEVNIGQQEYYSYIYYPISVSVMDAS